MSIQLEFFLLGALEARVGDRPVVVGSPRQRTILAMLLLSADRVISVDSLIEAVWNGSPPATGRTQVAICIAALRKAFKAAGYPGEVIVTAASGYVLRSAEHRIDAVEFTAAVQAAHLAVERGQIAEATDLLGRALSLWSGPALTGVTGFPVESEAARLEEERLTAYEMRTALQLEQGQHGPLISELAAMVQEHPLREQVRAQLMLAQYRAGRRAEALETFRAGRDHLVREIGIEPGWALQELHNAILADDPSLALLPHLGIQFGEAVTPAQLPPDLPGFIGRRQELQILDGLLSAETGNAPAVGVVMGAAGVGKTVLTLHWAHRVAHRFPDGQLFADLNGYDEHAQPREPHAVLEVFLRTLGVPDERIPEELPERAALYRSLLDRRRVLVVLDNVRGLEQILPLLPGSGRCCVVATGRCEVGRLLGGHGTTQVRLGVLAEREAVELLDVAIGDSRPASEPESVAELGKLCGHLPLALRISATRLARKPHWTVKHLVSRLKDHRRRLDELDADNDLRTSFEPSYRLLRPNAALLYRRLGLLDSANFEPWVAAALLNTDLHHAEDLLEQLVDAQLLEVGSGRFTARYRLHELLWLHAREHAFREETRTQLRAASERVLSGWLALTAEAHRRDVGDAQPVLADVSPLWHWDRDYLNELLREPRAWLEQERASIVAAMNEAVRLQLGNLASCFTHTVGKLFPGQDAMCLL
ncbi:transcriptional regulator [Amycolatopsis rhizosphaerae]|uniref:Transcriptional regulator n=1 Tax=Amycolatopsis rhizosphaerae TaxID=2053003 RepID=A0A558D0Z9_9PSEU|nr:AfsR/SARP family transcriptional regulator [Amycolatopsis rhizosphaerae]TVT54692.1 transcriptional regulator [Amycolatopsis rhizosphaerae]